MVFSRKTAAVPVEHIARSIRVLRGHKVLLDDDLATLYGVTTGTLIQAIKRNMGRFPADFMFQLSLAEWTILRSQIVISRSGHGGRRYAPYAFTEQGVAMLSSVLRSDQAIAVNIEIMRTFVRLREVVASNRELARRFDQLESRLEKLTAHDKAIAAILAALRELMAPLPAPKGRPIGFTAELEALK